MADTPADEIAASFQITVLAFVCTDHPGQRLGYTGLLGNNKFHSFILLFKKLALI
jgi:hypothetical protein